MFIILIIINYIKCLEVYLLNKGNSKYLEIKNRNPTFSENPTTLYEIQEGKTTQISIALFKGTGDLYSIFTPNYKTNNVEFKENEKGIKIKKEKVSKNTYKLKYNEKCLTALNNKLIWEECNKINKNQFWEFIYPKNTKFINTLKKLLGIKKEETSNDEEDEKIINQNQIVDSSDFNSSEIE